MNTKPKVWLTVTEADQVTPEILAAAEHICEGWYADDRIDWENFLERLEECPLGSGESLDLGGKLTSPAIEAIKVHIRKYRSQG